MLTEQIGNVLNAATFIVFGAVILGGVWSKIGAVEVVYAVLSLTVIRMVPVAIAMLGTRARLATVAFLGWFGPRGLASIVFGGRRRRGRELAAHVGAHRHHHRHGRDERDRPRRLGRAACRALRAWCSVAVDRGRAPMESIAAPHQRSRFGSVAPPS